MSLPEGVSVVATYRLQLHRGFTLFDAADVCGYVADLGISHVYTSPILQAVPGSMHGYDVVDHTRVADDLGGEPGHEAFRSALIRHGLHHVLDIVPNHMAIETPGNAWWTDVLENGPSSRFAQFFDVDWAPTEATLQNRLLVPVLGDHYGTELLAGRLQVVRDASRFWVAHHEHRFPVGPISTGLILDRLLSGRLAAELTDADAQTLGFLAQSLRSLPRAVSTDWASVERRHRDTVVARRLLADWAAAGSNASVLDRALAELNADAMALHALLEEQNYRLAYWRYGVHEVDYRRFFDITSLAGLRTENPRVFAAVHELPLRWVAEGHVQGLRVDHVDGLLDPAGYCRELTARAPDAWVVVEKILAADEQLRAWGVDGTTGYDVATEVTRLFVNPAAEAVFDRIHAGPSFADVATAAKRVVVTEVLSAEVSRLVERFRAVCESNLEQRDHGRVELRRALEAVLVAFPVYRTYLRRNEAIGDADRRVVNIAVDIAADRAFSAVDEERPDPALVKFLGRVLLGEVPGEESDELALRFQQLSGPVMAKALEDTAMYRHTRLLCLNDVGSEPDHFGGDVHSFHEFNARQQIFWPSTMTVLSTHDSKRSEDVRARLCALTWFSEEWADAVQTWKSRHHDAALDDAVVNLVFQTLAGAWPISDDRIAQHLTKAVREAKVGSSWLRPVEEYERGVLDLAHRMIADRRTAADMESMRVLTGPVAQTISLSQKLVQLTLPGIPDVYQGSELVTDSLVDPDNRRPVEFERRRRLLAGIIGSDPGSAEVPDADKPDADKLRIVHAALQMRSRHPEAFGRGGSYEPLHAHGSGTAEALAFVRGGRVATVVPVGPASEFADRQLRLPPGSWTGVLDGVTHPNEVRVGDLWSKLPVALLLRG